MYVTVGDAERHLCYSDGFERRRHAPVRNDIDLHLKTGITDVTCRNIYTEKVFVRVVALHLQKENPSASRGRHANKL